MQVLRDGFWDRTEVIQSKDGPLRVRKVSKGTGTPGQWGVSTLRREIQYMCSLDDKTAEHFPKVLSAWDDGLRIGYETEYVSDAVAASDLAKSASLDQVQANIFQDKLAQVMFDTLHIPIAEHKPPLSEHVVHVINTVLNQLTGQREFTSFIEASALSINDKQLLGPRKAMDRLTKHAAALQNVDDNQQVRLHGDCFLENMLISPPTAKPGWPSQLILVDPVSVAGIFQGHPLFDLVKYESYASGELPALRSEKIKVSGFDNSSQHNYVYSVCAQDPVIKPFYQIDWQSRYRAAYMMRYGQIDMSTYNLFDAYFALVMAVCTDGLQRRGRLLKGTLALNATL